MENNKAYLRNIHYVFLIALGVSLLAVYGENWLRELAGGRNGYVVLNALYYAGLYSALGIMTSKWKEAGIAAVAAIVISLSYGYFFSTTFGLNPLRIAYLFLLPVPLTLFIALQTGWTNKTLIVYALMIVATFTLYLGIYTDYGLHEILSSVFRYKRTESRLLSLVLSTGGFVTSTIFTCEILNYASGKSHGKTRLLNLDNDYNKLSGIIVFWSLKTCTWALLAAAAQHIYFFMGSFSRDHGMFSQRPGIDYYVLLTGLVSIISYVVFAIFIAWYLRKFLIEYFITYDFRSKFLYWFCLLPVIGFIAFAVAQADAKKQEGYSEKVNSIGGFEGSGSTSVTVVFFLLMFLRFIMRMGMGESTGIVLVPTIISFFLFIWMMADKTGFYVSLLLNLLVLAVGIVLISDGYLHRGIASIMFPLVMLNMMHLVLLFPVYHFYEFEYIPAENPDPEKPAGEHLFG